MDSTATSCVLLDFEQQDEFNRPAVSLCVNSPESSVMVLDFNESHNYSKHSPDSSIVVLDFNEPNDGQRSPDSSMLILNFDIIANSGLLTSPLKPACASTPLIQKTAPSEAVAKNALRQLSFTELEFVHLCNLQESCCAMTNFSWPGIPRDYTLCEQSSSLMAVSVQDPISSVSNLSRVLESEPRAIAFKCDFLEVLHMNGCGEQCASTKHHLSPTDALRYHEHFDSLSQMAKKQWLLDYFIMTSSGKGKELDIPHLVCGKEVCLPLWLATLGISQSYYYSVRTLFLRGHKRIVNQVQRNPTERTNEAMAWMDNFVSLMGDKMPDRATVHLPSCLSKLSVYQRMAGELRQRGRSKIVSQSQFFEIWKTHFHHVTIPKENRFTKCDICVLLYQELEKTTDRNKRQELEKI